MAGNFTSHKGLRFPNGIPRVETNREQIPERVNEMSNNSADTDIAATAVAHNSDLRGRIAYAIAQADGDLPGMEPDTSDYELADAVIAELGLRPERGQRSNPGGPLWGSDNRHNVTRYVTEWETDD